LFEELCADVYRQNLQIMKTLLAFSFLATTIVLLAVEPPAPKFRAVDIDTAVSIGYGLAIVDINGDGKPDIAAHQHAIFVHGRPHGALRNRDLFQRRIVRHQESLALAVHANASGRM
jgi:hypothetical protein